MAALILALAATAMAIPYLVQASGYESLPDPTTGLPSYLPPDGWQRSLWRLAFAVGISSFVLSLMRHTQERQRGARSGVRLARYALAVGILGACVWALPVCVEASTGL